MPIFSTMRIKATGATGVQGLSWAFRIAGEWGCMSTVLYELDAQSQHPTECYPVPYFVDEALTSLVPSVGCSQADGLVSGIAIA
jgi:hypothetical protein